MTEETWGIHQPQTSSIQGLQGNQRSDGDFRVFLGTVDQKSQEDRRRQY